MSCQENEPLDPVDIRGSESDINWRSGLVTTSIDSSFSPTCGNIQSIFAGVSKNNGLLEFDSIAHFENCVKCLEDLLEAHLAQFESTYYGKTADQLDSIELAIGFNYFQPLEDFEQSKQFNSRRAMIESEIVSWLDQDNPVFDASNDPDEKDDLSEVVRTLLSEDGEVRIQGTLIDLTDISSVVSASCSPFGDGCKRFEKTVEYHVYPNDMNKRIKARLENRAYPWKIWVSAKIVNFKKKGNRWNRARASLSVAVQGRFADSSCGSQENVRDWNGPKKRKELKARYTYWSTLSFWKHVCFEQHGIYEVSNEFFGTLNH